MKTKQTLINLNKKLNEMISIVEYYQHRLNLKENNNIVLEKDIILYHATYKPYLKNIKQNGLIGPNNTNKIKKSWEDSENNVIYFAGDKNVAYSYAETSEDVPEEWIDDDKIIILSINTKDLDKSKLFLDKQNRSNFDDESDYQDKTFEYHGTVSPTLLKLVKI
jgi:hypothetical protein